ncbi:hypothetical protein [Methanocaldococcus sp.]
MFKYAIIGSGVAGSTIAKELNDVVIIEKGDDKVRYNNEGKNVEVIYTIGLGGSSVFSLGNAVKLKIKGYRIEKDIYKEIWEELKIKEPDDEFLSNLDKEFLSLGFKKMSKFIDFDRCNKCGLCSRKLCQAKWTPLDYLKESKAKIVKNFKIRDIVKEKDYYKIVGENSIVKAKNVIVSAGAVGSSRLLMDKDERIGENLFIDTFVTVGGVLKDSNLNKNVSMLVYKDFKNYILATHYSKLLYAEIKKEESVEEKDIVGIMIKIKDENNGKVLRDRIEKEISKEDLKILGRGIAKASKYLNKIGVDEIYVTRARGSHPGGTLSFLKDFTLDDGLYVCDSSLFKESLGKPPIVSIIALAKKFVREML